MKIVSDNDLCVYTDPEGDTLTLLTTVRQRDVEKAADIAQREALDALKDLGISLEEAMKQAQGATEADKAAARERSKKQELSPALRRFRLEAIARVLTIGGEGRSGPDILKAYEDMDAASVKWVDEQVASVWERALPDDASRESPAARLGLPDEPERTA
jgi:hypothetical protein